MAQPSGRPPRDEPGSERRPPLPGLCPARGAASPPTPAPPGRGLRGPRLPARRRGRGRDRGSPGQRGRAAGALGGPRGRAPRGAEGAEGPPARAALSPHSAAGDTCSASAGRRGNTGMVQCRETEVQTATGAGCCRGLLVCLFFREDQAPITVVMNSSLIKTVNM